MNHARIAELERRHKALEAEIAEALIHRSADDPMVADLKRRKLHIRDEIEQLRDKQERERPNLTLDGPSESFSPVTRRIDRGPLREKYL
jgi:hypothetical protein